MSVRAPRFLAVFAACVLAAVSANAYQAPARAVLHVVRNVRLADSADAAGAKRSMLVLRDGRIEKVQDDGAAIPPGARVVDGNGALALPAFVDAYSFAGFAMPQPDAVKDMAPKTNADVLVDMREANRKGILCAFRAADAFKNDAETDKRYRASGFGAWLAAPHGELLSGASALVTSRDCAARDRIRVPIVLDHGGFDATGPGYPGTLMGSIAQLRQLFLDASWVRELERRNEAGLAGRRAPYDAELVAARAILDRKRRLVCEAETASDVERWIALADQFGFDVAISGGREAWRRAKLLADRKIPVYLTLAWGEEVEDPHAKEKERAKKDAKSGDAAQDAKADAPAKPESKWIYDEPMRVKEEKRRLWEEKRDCAIRLQEAGVLFAFGTGKDTPKALLDHARTLVEKGLPKDAALRALTTGAAELCGAGKMLGKLEPGFDASLALWSSNPLADKDAKLVWLFVEGVPYEFELDSNELKGKPDDGVDLTGAWTLEFESSDVKPAKAVLEMDHDGALKGKLEFVSPIDGASLSGDFEGHVAGKKLRLTGKVKTANRESDVTIEGEVEGKAWKGTTTWKWSGGETTNAFKAAKTPQSMRSESDGLDRSDDDDAMDPHEGGGR